MPEISWHMFSMHVTLAITLFFIVNWIGKHSVDFGYISTTLFEEPNENVALNFFIRALSPAVYTIVISAILVSINHSDLRINIFIVAIYYYVLRAVVIFAFNRHRLISWPRYIGHAFFGIYLAILAYQHLILPNRSLIPDLETAGNELWLAILAFMYAVANKIPLPSGPGARRRNGFVKLHYASAKRNFGTTIDDIIKDEILKLIAYSVLIYEDYCRPPAIRSIERLAYWKKNRTTGIMQVTSPTSLSDKDSVERGLQILKSSWENYSEDSTYYRVRSTISDYNKDDDYISRVIEVMQILAERSDQSFKVAYDRIWSD